ncbi:MAG: AI-2E family transporter, partial [Perlucidibaca sp.]
MPKTAPLLTRLPLLLGLLTLIYLTYRILSPFIVPVAWAAILVFVTWPVYKRLLRLTGQRENVAATLMTTLLTLLLVGPMAWLLVMLQAEIKIIYAHLGDFLGQEKLPLPPLIHQRAPWLAGELEDFWSVLHDDPGALKEHLRSMLNLGFGQVRVLAGGIGRNVAKLAFTVMAAFFFYRDGLRIIGQLRDALAHIVPRGGERYLSAAGNMTRAVVFGIVLTALAQSALAGVGY